MKSTPWGTQNQRKSAGIAASQGGSEANQKARFPAPFVNGENGRSTVLKDGLKLFQGRWDAIETFSDRMDDSPEEQEAFVKEFFLRDLYRSGDFSE